MTYLINFLTWFRLISGPIIFFLILIFDSYGFALILFMLASISDYLDGYLARKYDCESVFGEILDPIADKILTLFLISTLSLYFQSLFYWIYWINYFIKRALGWRIKRHECKRGQ